MDPALAQVLATLITALATVAVAWMGVRGRRNGSKDEEE